jgi:hypothetical protein
MEVNLGEDMKIFEYDTTKYDFAGLVESLFDGDLQNLDNQDQKTDLTLGNDTKTAFHKVFYDRIDSGWSEFDDLYISFIREVIHPLFEDDTLVYQKTPGIRFNRPGAKAVYKWHSDGDNDHKHPSGEVNVFLPITKCFDTNAMWVESIPGLGDFHPVKLEYGQYLLGYLNQCRHGNKTNETGKTRVSFDFRVIPGFAYDSQCKQKTCTTKQPLIIGEYYEMTERIKTPDTYDPIENAKLGAAC